jgi:hypothetical protein
MRTPQVLNSEVGSRDGLQSVSRTLPTAHELAWIDALHAAGLREIAPIYSMTPEAGLTHGLVYANGRAPRSAPAGSAGTHR